MHARMPYPLSPHLNSHLCVVWRVSPDLPQGPCRRALQVILRLLIDSLEQLRSWKSEGRGRGTMDARAHGDGCV